MEIRDPVHGSIQILDEEIPIIRDRFFQRLRNIKQLGFSEYVFPGATHSRFIHSIGVMDIARKSFDKIFKTHLGNSEIKRIKETFKLAALLHDIGHAPLSHSTESVMPDLKTLGIPSRYLMPGDLKKNRRANHEDYTVKAIIGSSFSQSFKEVESKYGVNRSAIAELVTGKTKDSDYFTFQGINYFPLLHQLISSELDADRMDYLLRDSYFCGVSYGNFDLDWLIDNLTFCTINKVAYLGISERAVVTFDDFLLSRFHMFLQVYFHYRSVCLEQLLFKFFETSPSEYVIPSDVEAYIEHDDYYLMKILRHSNNRYAKAIAENQIPHKIYESFNETQGKRIIQIERYLKAEGIEYIKSSSKGRLSKYQDLKVKQLPIFVVRNLHGSDKRIYTEIEKATDLFFKFSKAHEVNRLHCDLKMLSAKQNKEIQKIIFR